MGYPHGCDWPGSPNNTCDEVGLQNFTGFTPFDKSEHYHKLCYIYDFENQTQVSMQGFNLFDNGLLTLFLMNSVCYTNKNVVIVSCGFNAC